jgi:hypothetical protein
MHHHYKPKYILPAYEFPVERIIEALNAALDEGKTAAEAFDQAFIQWMRSLAGDAHD